MTTRPPLTLFAEFHHSGDHEGAWRLPAAEPARVDDLEYYRKLTETAARGRFDSVFFADFVGYDPLVEHCVRWPYEPTTLLSALASSVPDIGVVATGSTVFDSPEQIARKFATLAQLSGGRAGWNIVTTGAPSAAKSFGRAAAPTHADRYAAAHGVVEHVEKLWSQQWGITGANRPLLVQAGASDTGRDFAARHADVVFTATPDLDAAVQFRSDVRSRAVAVGRHPDSIRVLPGLFVALGSTDREARALRDSLDAGLSDGTVRGVLALYGVPALADLDAPLSDSLGSFGATSGITSRLDVLERIARTLPEPVTLRALVKSIAGSRGHLRFIGTPDAATDLIAEWYERGAADGFVVKFSHNPGGTDAFVDTVIPHLQRRGITPTDYRAESLRDRLFPQETSS